MGRAAFSHSRVSFFCGLFACFFVLRRDPPAWELKTTQFFTPYDRQVPVGATFLAGCLFCFACSRCSMRRQRGAKLRSRDLLRELISCVKPREPLALYRAAFGRSRVSVFLQVVRRLLFIVQMHAKEAVSSTQLLYSRTWAYT